MSKFLAYAFMLSLLLSPIAGTAQSSPDRVSPCTLQAQRLCEKQEGIVSLRGEVTSQGTAIPDAEIVLQEKEKAENSADPYVSVSDSLGRFAFVGLKAGDYVLSIARAGYERATRGVTLAVNKTVELGKIPLQVATTLQLPPKVNASSERVYYVTDRRPFGSCQPSQCYADERAPRGNTAYGYAVVSVPDSSLFPVATQNVERTDENGLFEEMRRQDSRPDREILVFIHGFDNSFESALHEAAMLRHDLAFKGPVLMFSWASRDLLDAYFEDESTIDWSTPHFREFLRHLDGRDFAKVHVIAHSMGNRLLLRSLETCLIPGKHGEMIFVAPDVDSDTFAEAVRNLKAQTSHLTMYGSRYDQALLSSQSLHRYPRAGLIGSHAIADGVDTVDVSDVDPTFLHHSYLVSATELENDVSALLSGQYPPGRARLHAVGQGANRFWQLK